MDQSVRRKNAGRLDFRKAAKWHVADGVIVTDAGDYGWLRSNRSFTNFELQIFDQHPQYPTGGFVGHIAPSQKVSITPNE